MMLFTLVRGLPGATGSFSNLWPELPLNGWLVLIALSFGPTLLGFGLYNTSMNYPPASIANLLAASEPAMTEVEAHVFLGERMMPVQIVGSLVILSAVLIVQLERRSRPSSE